MKIKILCGTTEYVTEGKAGESFLEVLRAQKIAFAAPCGGKGLCGRCRIKLVSGKALTKDGTAYGEKDIPACGSFPLSECTIAVEESTGTAIEKETISEAPVPQKLRASVDLGTTGITVGLTDGERIFAQKTEKNRQCVYGADVMTRIEMASNGGKLMELQAIVKKQLTEMTDALCESLQTTVEQMVISGNTTMVYLLMGWLPKSLGVAPYQTRDLSVAHTTVGGRSATVMPGISAFVGGDIVSGLTAVDITSKQSPVFFLDLGTNGEMALWTGAELFVTSVPAGPAFESGKVAYGSELLELAWQKLKAGEMSRDGLLSTDTEYQEDIRALQLAKGATYAGIKCLLKAAEMEETDIESVLLSGTFGEYLNPEAAAGTGMVPAAFEDKIIVMGNTSLKGAVMAAGNEDGFFAGADELRRKAKVVELAMEPEFSNLFVANMNF